MTRKLIYTILILLVFWRVGFAAQTEERNALSFGATYIGDLVVNMHGGIETGAVFLGMANLEITFDTERANWWRGGELFVKGSNIHGRSPTERLVGDFQVISNIDGGGEYTFMRELWYKQRFSNFSISIGLQDVNNNFLVIENGGNFINSSFGVPSLIAANIPIPNFTINALGLKLNWDITERFSWRGAVFDGNPNGFESNRYNLNWRWNRNDGILGITELQLNNNEGVYKLGFYYHRKSEETTANFVTNYGFYIIADQDIIVWNDNKKLSAFALAAISPQKVNAHNYYLSAGINYYGIFNRQQDIFGLAVSHAGFRNSRHETVIETFYLLQLSDNFFLQPSFQYVINPLGNRVALQNASVGILRFGVNF